MLATLATVSRRVNTRGSIQQTHLYGQKPVAGVVQRVNVDAMLATQMVEHPHLALVGRQVPKHLFARLSATRRPNMRVAAFTQPTKAYLPTKVKAVKLCSKRNNAARLQGTLIRG